MLIVLRRRGFLGRRPGIGVLTGCLWGAVLDRRSLGHGGLGLLEREKPVKMGGSREERLFCQRLRAIAPPDKGISEGCPCERGRSGRVVKDRRTQRLVLRTLGRRRVGHSRSIRAEDVTGRPGNSGRFLFRRRLAVRSPFGTAKLPRGTSAHKVRNWPWPRRGAVYLTGGDWNLCVGGVRVEWTG